MFTGIIEAVGRVQHINPRSGDVRLSIATGKLDLTDVKLGDSIATNGICLTVIELTGQGFVADVSNETLRRTCLQTWKVGTAVNLEKALMPTSRLGGHIVSGHVDGIGHIISVKPDARSIQYQVQAPAELAKYISEKGSITVDGVSLTVNAIEGAVFSLNIVPHTAQETNVINWQAGSIVNLEVDVLARYIERLLLGEKAAQATPKSDISLEFLAKHGFMR
ncbi:riboflavin synthase [Agitococcus lubricus]|uniref:Riboflavin synthase n=1 Tax=Agitococcus lubricus TaxID=1077255 RepID=A0A2T5IUG1_9GAMM|nr:riboflavin synthase [Agitococcus lubricus]PTQ87535.1 riboflavin synthase alpha chain [Agitococcus lubricus]